MRTALLACSLLLGLSCPPLFGEDARINPVMVIAMAPVDELLADVDYLTKTFEAEDAGKMVRQLAGPYLGGIDRKRPWGAYVTLADGQVKAIGFVPITSLKVELAILEEQIGKAEELDGGIFKVALPPVVGEDGSHNLFLKEQDGWAFYSDKVENLSVLPKDPVALLGGLEKKYDLGSRFIIENVSAEVRQEFINEIKKKFKEVRVSPEFNPSDVPEEWIRSFEEAVLKYADGTKSIDVGFTIDSKQANVAFSLAVETISRSELPKSHASMQLLTTAYSGVLVPGSAIVIHRAAKYDQKEIAVWDRFFDQILKEAKAKEDLPQEKQALAKEALPLFERVMKAGHADGNVDGGTSYLINDEGKLTTLGGVHLAGLKNIEAEARALFEKHKETDPDLAKLKIEWDFAEHGKVRIIKANSLEGAPHGSSLLGDDASYYFGIDGEYLYMASGQDALKHLKEAIDRSAAKPNFKAAPLRMRVDVRPLVKVAINKLGSESPIVEKLEKKLEEVQGKTSININLLPGESGLEGRVEVGEGVLNIMPEVGQLIQQAFMNTNPPMLDIPSEEPATSEAPK